LMWANQVVWDLVSDLSDEEFERPLGEYVGSIRSRYVREELFEALKNLNEKTISMLEEPVAQEHEIETKKGTMRFSIEEFFFNLANHATYHRGQIVKGLRLIGKEAVPTDYILYRIDTL